jgi:hypothetical protein
MRKFRLLGISGALLMTISGPAFAADIVTPEQVEISADSGWTFTIAPYVWAAGIKGDVGLFGLPPQEIDASFVDVLENFDIGAMAVAEARNGQFFIGADIFYVKLSTEIDTPFGAIADSVDVTAASFMFTGLAGYSLVYEQGVNLDVFAGARVWHSDTTFDLNNPCGICPSSADDGDTWVDPLVGIKGRAELGSGFYLTGWGMIGGFGVSSDLMWDLMGGLGYEFSDIFSVVAGYRAVSVDYSNDGFVYDIIQQGPILGAVFQL